MTGRAVAINGRYWLADVVEHWPPGGPGYRPLAYDVFLDDPGGRHQWIGRPRVRADVADLSTDGLRRPTPGATLRSWRDASEGRICTRIFADLPPLGERDAGDRERLIPRLDSRSPLAEIPGQDGVQRRLSQLSGGGAH